MKITKWISSILLAVVFSTSAIAMGTMPKGDFIQTDILGNVYAGVQLGYSFTNKVNFVPGYPSVTDLGQWGYPAQTFAESIGSAPSYGAKIGYRFNSAISTDISYTYRGNYSWRKWFPGDGVTYWRYRKINHISNQTVMANLYFTPKLLSWGAVKPYVNAGIGLAINRVGKLISAVMDGVTIPLVVDPVPVVAPGYLKAKTTCDFAWQVGAGAKVKVNKRVYVNLGYLLVNTGMFATGKSWKGWPGIPNLTFPAIAASHVFLHEFYVGFDVLA